jgi:hypothetical protein
MKQTAVEWLREQYDNNPESFITEDEFEKALEMEKQQIDDAFEDGYQSGYKDNGISGEQYYNDTFKEIEKL